MSDSFKAEVFQNEFLPAGTGEVHAIMTVSAGEDVTAAPRERLFGILCDSSGSMDGGKIVAAKAAMARLVAMLPADTHFFLVTGSDEARLVCPVARARGDDDKATALLGKAVRIAASSGNEATAKLLRQVVDVVDVDKGTVRLKQSVSKEDSMALETRSTKTARISKTQ